MKSLNDARRTCVGLEHETIKTVKETMDSQVALLQRPLDGIKSGEKITLQSVKL